MAGEVERVDISVESRILGNLITSGELLGKIRSIIDPTLFESPISRIVGQWVLDYYDRMGDAPNKAVADIFIARRGELSKADQELVNTFLRNCSASWKPTNVKYAEQVATEFFQRRSLDRLSDGIKGKAGSGNIEGAQRLIAEYVKPELVHSKSISLLTGVKQIQHAFRNDEEELFSLHGGMDKLVGGPLCRGELVAYMGAKKTGKTWWLIDNAVTALTRGQRVLYISLEMTEAQMTRRFWQYMSGCSRFGENAPGSAFVDAGNGKWNLVQGERSTRKIDLSDEGIKAVQEKYLAMTEDNLKIRCYPTGQLTLQQLRSELKVLEVFEGFIPDVIVIDYADIMCLPPGKEMRHRLDTLWQGLKGITNEYNILIVTASQTTGRDVIAGRRDADEGNVAEAASKLNHVNRMITINRNNKDKRLGIYRLTCQTIRDGKECFDTLVVCSCLEIGRPWMDDRFMSVVNFPDDEPAEAA